jgi:hypothetical protein
MNRQEFIGLRLSQCRIDNNHCHAIACTIMMACIVSHDERDVRTNLVPGNILYDFESDVRTNCDVPYPHFLRPWPYEKARFGSEVKQDILLFDALPIMRFRRHHQVGALYCWLQDKRHLG